MLERESALHVRNDEIGEGKVHTYRYWEWDYGGFQDPHLIDDPDGSKKGTWVHPGGLALVPT